jgi:hypothetical protein
MLAMPMEDAHWRDFMLRWQLSGSMTEAHIIAIDGILGKPRRWNRSPIAIMYATAHPKQKTTMHSLVAVEAREDMCCSTKISYAAACRISLARARIRMDVTVAHADATIMIDPTTHPVR